MPSGSGQVESFVETYSLKNGDENICLIFDIREFDEGLHVANRDKNKADMDLANFVNTFKGLNFDIHTNINLSRSQIGKKVIDVLKILSYSATIVVIVISKGHQDYFLATDGLFKIDWIWTPLMATNKSSVLIDQPKLFIFQVEEILFTDVQSDAPTTTTGSEKPIPAPESDMFIIHHRIPGKFEFPNYDWSFSKAIREVFTPEQAKKDHIGKLMPKVNSKMASVYREAEIKKEIKDKIDKFIKDGVKADETAKNAATEIVTKERDIIEAERKGKEAKEKLGEFEETVKTRKLTQDEKTEKQIAQGQVTRNENEAKNLREAVVNARELLAKSVEDIKNNSKEAVKSAQDYVKEAENEIKKRNTAIEAAQKVLDNAKVALDNLDKNASLKDRELPRLDVDAAEGGLNNAVKSLEEAKKEVTVAENEVKSLEEEREKKSLYKVQDYLDKAQEEEKKRIVEQMETTTTTTTTYEGATATKTVEPMEVEKPATIVEPVKEQKENQPIFQNFPSKPIVATTVSHLRKLFYLVDNLPDNK